MVSGDPDYAGTREVSPLICGCMVSERTASIIEAVLSTNWVERWMETPRGSFFQPFFLEKKF
ncbi:hypothetical protein [Hydrogenispora ethanolica]|uniref:hypothetical protein n=1 Tax=Hydrogenispora ethanolica TaxID=1082276 RepID=UPI0010531384|nr:hypothetical protein [Hydrogenispora ethanolica]